MSSNLILLQDCVGYAELLITESTGGVCKFRGKFQEANAVNKNKRMYPYEVLSSNVDKLMETVNSRGLFGELDHPSDSIVHLSNVSHLITKLWFEGSVLMGEGELLNTPSGKVLRGLIDSGARIGMSSRGVGNGQVNNEGVLIIDNTYKLITFDAVADPSTFSAFQSKIVSKKEHFETKETKNSIKNETSCIDKVNTNALISFFGQLVQKHVSEVKDKIKS